MKRFQSRFFKSGFYNIREINIKEKYEKVSFPEI